MRVNIVYAVVGQAWEVDLECPTGTSVVDAVRLALAHDTFNGVDLNGEETFAVWNQVVPHEHLLHDGDRVEILRDLVMSPMERRRLQAQLKSSD